jgi:hypothetical protein
MDLMGAGPKFFGLGKKCRKQEAGVSFDARTAL